MDWKELRAGSAGIMQNYCSEPKKATNAQYRAGLVKGCRRKRISGGICANPHVLMRILEDFNILYCDRLIIEACLARKASSKSLGFVRQDYPDLDPPDWHKFYDGQAGTRRNTLENDLLVSGSPE